MSEARIQHFYDESTGTLSYVVSDAESGHAAVIDPVISYSMVSGHINAAPSDVIVEYVHKEKLGVEWILETHAHADHVTGAQYIKSKLGGKVAIGEGIRAVQAHFGPVFNLGPPFAADGHQFDRLFSDSDAFKIGELDCEVIATPGHTNDSVSYKIGSAVFVGDSMFMPIQRVLALPGDTKLYMCHDYMPGGRDLRWECTVDEQRAANIHVREDVSKSEFAVMRKERDETLNLPALIVPAIQVNIRAGHLPDVEDNDIVYLKTPVDTL